MKILSFIQTLLDKMTSKITNTQADLADYIDSNFSLFYTKQASKDLEYNCMDRK